MTIRVNIHGELFLPEEARVSVFDRQFLYGDGAYETLRTYGGRLFLPRAHLERLHDSADGLGIRIPWDVSRLELEMERTLAAAGNPESVLRVILTRGSGGVGLDPNLATDPLLVMIASPLKGPPPVLAREGIDVLIPSIRRTSPRALASHIKSGNYLNQTIALAEGRKSGAFEVIMLDEAGRVTEGSTSNLFFVRDGRLFTPSIEVGVLPGLTRAVVLGLARQLELSVEEGGYPAEDFLEADEAFVTATIKEILPIKLCGERRFPSPLPGPMTSSLQLAFRKLTQRAAEGRLSHEEIRGLLEG